MSLSLLLSLLACGGGESVNTGGVDQNLVSNGSPELCPVGSTCVTPLAGNGSGAATNTGVGAGTGTGAGASTGSSATITVANAPRVVSLIVNLMDIATRMGSVGLANTGLAVTPSSSAVGGNGRGVPSDGNLASDPVACDNGVGTYTPFWNDSDTNSVVSTGDGINITYTDCAVDRYLVDGFYDFTPRDFLLTSGSSVVIGSGLEGTLIAKPTMNVLLAQADRYWTLVGAAGFTATALASTGDVTTQMISSEDVSVTNGALVFEDINNIFQLGVNCAVDDQQTAFAIDNPRIVLGADGFSRPVDYVMGYGVADQIVIDTAYTLNQGYTLSVSGEVHSSCADPSELLLTTELPLNRLNGEAFFGRGRLKITAIDLARIPTSSVTLHVIDGFNVTLEVRDANGTLLTEIPTTWDLLL